MLQLVTVFFFGSARMLSNDTAQRSNVAQFLPGEEDFRPLSKHNKHFVQHTKEIEFFLEE